MACHTAYSKDGSVQLGTPSSQLKFRFTVRFIGRCRAEITATDKQGQKYTLEPLFMVALWNRADHYIFALWCLLSFFSSPNLSRRRLDGCHTFTHGVCGLSANLRCRYETCCTWLAGNTGPKSRQKSTSGHHRATLSGYTFTTKAYIDNRKKIVKRQYVLQMFPQYGELRPTSG